MPITPLPPQVSPPGGALSPALPHQIGGAEEEQFAASLSAARFDKPVFALVAGRSAPEGLSMGHAGALVHGAHGSFAVKKAALERAGVQVFGSLDEMVEGVCAAAKRQAHS